MTGDERLNDYKKNGFTVFKNVFNNEIITDWKASYANIVDRQTRLGSNENAFWLSSALEYEPKLFLPAIAHPTLLDFAEQVLGPFVQLDNLTFMAFPSISKEDAAGKVSGWHRDIWAYKPTHDEYVPPLAGNAITYLQDMTDDYGPLRVIPGSHRSTISIDDSRHKLPHKDEILVPVKAGDVVFTHAALYHSGTPNHSGNPRYFFSIYYNKSWLKFRDNHQGPAVQSILEIARDNNDRRLMRLFGEDPLLFERANSGFGIEDEIRWKAWIKEDLDALKSETPIGLERWNLK